MAKKAPVDRRDTFPRYTVSIFFRPESPAGSGVRQVKHYEGIRSNPCQGENGCRLHVINDALREFIPVDGPGMVIEAVEVRRS